MHRRFDRSAARCRRACASRCRTTSFGGLGSRATQQGGFYHDGRFATLLEAVNHYDGFQRLGLTDAEKKDQVEYLKGL